MTGRPFVIPWLLFAAAAASAQLPGNVDESADPAELAELVITARRLPSLRFEEIGNISAINADGIDTTGAQHPSQIAVRVPGAWVARGSGQEHLTAIRSPVLTGPGSCGAFLVLEDGIPTRPAGFCNVNQLMEVPMSLARGIEVVRGPASALYGANGLHGIINVLLPHPGDGDPLALSAEIGPDHYLRGTFAIDTWDGQRGFTLGTAAESYGGFRDESGHDQARAYLRTTRELGNGQLDLGLSGSWLEQETAGLITGLDAWRDPLAVVENPNPEAYRNARSARAHARWRGPAPNVAGAPDVDARAYIRRSSMEFLQHFLPGQPIENNDQTSAGIMLGAIWHTGDKSGLQAGIELEGGRAGLREVQPRDTTGSAFLVETRPKGLHYDFELDLLSAAAYVQYEFRFTPAWQIRLGARLETLRYDYDNLAADGNLRDDGTACGFGGCLYTRPPDDSNSFTNLAPNLGLYYRLSPSVGLYAIAARGFRPPQATELYRLQSGQAIADLDSESLDSLELGLRWQHRRLNLEIAAFHMRKDNFIFRDASGFNVSDGKTRHVGLEFEMLLNLTGGFYAHVAATTARHTYRFDRDASRGEQIRRGAIVDTAPRIVGSSRLGWRGDRASVEAEWLHQGSYWLNAANTARYDGHDLANLRLSMNIARSWQLSLRLNNVFDRRYAERADFAFGSYRYSPGRGRETFVEIGFRQAR